MPVIYCAVQRFGPDFQTEYLDWERYIEWSGLTQLREVISLDGILCPSVIDELTDEDWQHNVQEDFVSHFFRDLDYLVHKVGGNDGANILAVIREPRLDEIVAFTDSRFDFRGFDLTEVKGGGISALVNCGGFPNAFSSSDLSECGLLTDHKLATHVQKRLRAEYPTEHHAYCDVWAIWQLKKEPEISRLGAGRDT